MTIKVRASGRFKRPTLITKATNVHFPLDFQRRPRAVLPECNWDRRLRQRALLQDDGLPGNWPSDLFCMSLPQFWLEIKEKRELLEKRLA